jgi:hypothetical protein
MLGPVRAGPPSVAAATLDVFRLKRNALAALDAVPPELAKLLQRDGTGLARGIARFFDCRHRLL